MHAGLGLAFQNLDGHLTDAEMYRHELALADRAEASGFDSVWTPEHHFSDYQLTPNVTQFLSWVAGRTTTVRLGHDGHGAAVARPGARRRELLAPRPPVGRPGRCSGIGRGLGRIEFDGFRLEMGESRRRFTEYTTAILHALEQGYIEYDGELYQQPRTEIRPRPLASFAGRTFASAISPQSMDLMAELGVGLMVIAQKPWETVEEELATYRRRYVEVNGVESTQADPLRLRRRPRRSGRGAADARRVPPALRPLDRRALPVRRRPLRRHRGLRVLRRRWPRTSRSTGSSSSTGSSPTSRCGARRTR